MFILVIAFEQHEFLFLWLTATFNFIFRCLTSVVVCHFAGFSQRQIFLYFYFGCKTCPFLIGHSLPVLLLDFFFLAWRFLLENHALLPEQTLRVNMGSNIWSGTAYFITNMILKLLKNRNLIENLLQFADGWRQLAATIDGRTNGFWHITQW